MVDGKENMHADAITYERFSEKQSLSRPTTADALARLAADEDGRLLRLARRLLGNEEDARDLIQDALLKAHLAIDDFRGEGSLAGWVRRIIINQGLKKLRRRSLSRRVAGLLRLGRDRQPGSASPELKASLREQARLLRSTMDKLSARQRTIFALRYLEQMKIAEISAATGIGSGTVKTHLVRALQRIRAAPTGTAHNAASRNSTPEVSNEQM
ncbi:MAG TPA: RNA polymerase sigma factor [Myxococcota bacterium]|nr:RNA polymerase sigma factor [Myxococcota bacterium]